MSRQCWYSISCFAEPSTVFYLYIHFVASAVLEINL
jgi:hypothetical protein